MYLFCFVAALILHSPRYECTRMLKVIPGVPRITYINDDYVEDVKLNVRRYGRKSEYVVNFEFTTKHSFGKNVSMSLIFYEYLHNEYRKSFVEMHGNICHFILEDELLGFVIRKTGLTTCPIKAGKYRLYNMTFDREFPNVFPFEKGQLEVIFTFTPTAKIIGKCDIVLTFKQRIV